MIGWFTHLKLSAKLVTGLLLGASVASGVGVFGITKNLQLKSADNKAYERVTVPLADLADMSLSLLKLRMSLVDAVEATDETDRQAAVQATNTYRREIVERGEKFEKSIGTKEGHKLFDEFTQAHNASGAAIDRVLELAKAGKRQEATALLHGAAEKDALHQQDILNRLIETMEVQARLTAEKNAGQASTAAIIMTVLLVAGVLLGFGMGTVVSANPLQEALRTADAPTECGQRDSGDERSAKKMRMSDKRGVFALL